MKRETASGEQMNFCWPGKICSAGPIKDYMDYVGNIAAITPTIPEPATLFLLTTGLLGLTVYIRKRRSKIAFSRKS